MAAQGGTGGRTPFARLASRLLGRSVVSRSTSPFAVLAASLLLSSPAFAEAPADGWYVEFRDEGPEYGPVVPVASEQREPSQERGPGAHGERGWGWYGWQSLLVHGAATGLFVAGAESEGRTSLGLGLTGWGLGRPVVHWSHGDVLKGLASLTVNVLVGYFSVVYSLERGCGDASYPPGEKHCAWYAPAVASMSAVAVVDALALGWQHEPESGADQAPASDRPGRAPSPKSRTPRREKPIEMAPRVSVFPRGALVGIGGTF
jgi:hypothetical protein